MNKLFQEIGTSTAVNILKTIGKDTLKARSYSMKGTHVIAGFDCTLSIEQSEALIAHADKILFWHYDIDPKCRRDISLWVGAQMYTIEVMQEA